MVTRSKENIFLKILIGRKGLVTTNSVEQFNRVMLEARESPITDALLILLKQDWQYNSSKIRAREVAR